MIAAENLTKRFGQFTAVDRLSFRVEEGQIFGFLGPNGAGKTTTIKMLCGLLLPTAGQGRVAGYDVTSQSEKIRQQIGYVSQRFAFYNDLTIRENLELYGTIYNLPARHRHERLGEIAEEFRFTGDLDSLVRTISGAIKQRLALGAALLHDPPILLLDEPTSGVDPAARRYFWDKIHHLSLRGKTILVTTHFLEEAEHCHRIILIDRGRIVAEDTPQDLKRHFQTETIEEAFLRAVLRSREGEG